MPDDGARYGRPEARLVPTTQSGLRTAETCFNAWDDNDNGLIDEGCGVPQGQIQVSLAWDEADADLDLFVSDPGGEVARASAATELGMTLSADCPTDRAECIEQPFETAFLEEDEVPPGKFIVRARSTALPRQTQSVKARLGVRSPLGTSSYQVEFFEVGQEVRLELLVADPTPSRPTSSATRQKTKPAFSDEAHP